jgi:hypothetical protein
MQESLNYNRDHPGRKVYINGKPFIYDPSLRQHRNSVIAETLQCIEHVILFSISNYLLKFSEAYKRFHDIKGDMPNDWYEYVEYGTTNLLSITLQRSGFTRETALYVKSHKSKYVVELPEQEIRIRRSLRDCESESIRQNVDEIILNLPELFVD